MNKRLLTLNDLCEYYSHRKKSMKFSSEESGEPIVVQIAGILKFEDSKDLTAGLTPVRLQACHTERNLNRSSISYETMRDKLLPTFKNRPILGYIHDVDGVPQFYGHNAHEKDGQIVYDAFDEATKFNQQFDNSLAKTISQLKELSVPKGFESSFDELQDKVSALGHLLATGKLSPSEYDSQITSSIKDYNSSINVQNVQLD